MTLSRPTRRPLLGTLLRYGFTAGLAAIVDLGGFIILTGAGMDVLPAAAASFLIANVVNYVTSARFAFRTTPSLGRYPIFLASASAGLIVNVAITTSVAAYFSVTLIVAKIVGIGVAFAVNFTLNSIFVFVRQ